MSWQQWVGKLAPWAVAAATAFLKEVVNLDLTWWPTFSALFLGLVQFIISMIPKKT